MWIMACAGEWAQPGAAHPRGLAWCGLTPISHFWYWPTAAAGPFSACTGEHTDGVAPALIALLAVARNLWPRSAVMATGVSSPSVRWRQPCFFLGAAATSLSVVCGLLQPKSVGGSTAELYGPCRSPCSPHKRPAGDARSLTVAPTLSNARAAKPPAVLSARACARRAMHHSKVVSLVVVALCWAAVQAAALPAAAAVPPDPRQLRSLAQAAAAAAPAVESSPGAPQPALQPEVIRPDQVYYPAKGVVAAPSTAIAAPQLNVSAANAATIEACAELCSQAAGCDWFWYCSTPGGCQDGSGGSLPFQQCRLLGEACSLPARGLTSSTAVQVTSGE